jgi:hypothetical protein
MGGVGEVWGKIWDKYYFKKNNCLNIKQLFVKVVVLPGFEPGPAEPKSDVLPLHYRTILTRFVKSSAKVR